MSTKNVIFSNPGDVIDFVKIVEKYPFDMDMKRGRYIVDAKSLLGLMNLGFDQKIELKVYDEECDEYYCDVNLDEDEYYRFVSSDYKECPYYRSGDEYKVVRHQM